MTRSLLLWGIVTAFGFAPSLLAQATGAPAMPVPIYFQQTFTTGMVGFTTNQTARLNVLNLNSVAQTPSPQAPNCTVELQFFDDKNNSVKQTVVPNFAPGTATSLDLPRGSVTSETATRAEIRGVVTINPSPSPVASPVAPGFCSVMITLEIFDATTNSTVSLTGDTRLVGLPGILPLAAQGSR